MKILYGITKSNFGGAQRYVFDLVTTMKKEGHEVAVVCGGNGILVDKLKAEQVRVITLDGLQRNIVFVREIPFFIEISKILKREKPDVFHINSSKMGGVGSVAARLVGVKKIIFTAHGWAFNEPRPVWQKALIKFFVWLTIISTHHTICVSEQTKKDVERWPFIKNRLVVIHNGVSEFNLAPREDKSFTVGAIAELHKIKGLDILLRAWSKFTTRHEAKLVIIGSGEEKDNLENLSDNLGVTNSVNFKGFVENARSLFSNFDIFVMPSRSEGLPYSLLEAGTAGLAVIATSVGGIPEVIENGTNGVLVPTENVEVLLSSLILLAEDDGLRKRLGAHLKASVQENFSLEKMVGETRSLYV